MTKKERDAARRAQCRAAAAVSARVRAERKAATANQAPRAAWPLRDAEGAPRPLATPADCMTVNSWAAQMVAEGRLTWKESHEITVATNGWLRAHGVAKTAEDAAAAQALLEELSGKGRAAATRAEAHAALARKRARTETTTTTEEVALGHDNRGADQSPGPASREGARAPAVRAVAGAGDAHPTRPSVSEAGGAGREARDNEARGDDADYTGGAGDVSL